MFFSCNFNASYMTEGSFEWQHWSWWNSEGWSHVSRINSVQQQERCERDSRRSRKYLLYPVIFKLKCKVSSCVRVCVYFKHLWLCPPWHSRMTGLFRAKEDWGSLEPEVIIDLQVSQLSNRGPALALPDGCLFVYGICLLVRRWSHGVWKKNEIVLIVLNY